MENQKERVLRVKDIQEYLNINKDKAYALVKLNGFPSFKVDSIYLTPESKFLEWLDYNSKHNTKILT